MKRYASNGSTNVAEKPGATPKSESIVELSGVEHSHLLDTIDTAPVFYGTYGVEFTVLDVKSANFFSYGS